MQTVKLINGLDIPVLGYGVFQINPNECERCVLDAISAGYRLIDTARVYNNEEGVGKAVRGCGLDREKLFITSKVLGARNIADARNIIDASLQRLNVGYLDLMLIHCPSGDNAALWRALEEYVEKGLIKSIGLSNFYKNDLDEIYDIARIKPVINQIECHVYRAGKKNQQLFEQHGMVMEAWSPLSSGKRNLSNEKILSDIAQKYGKSNAQVALKYLIERGIIAIAKTAQKQRMEENLNIFDFNLSEGDMTQIASLDKGKSVWGMYD